jgi:hypothetical protein
MDWVVQIGLIELAIGGLLGWAMVVRDERPEWLRRIGVVAPQRIRQVHLDYVMMGLILIGVGLAVPDLPQAVAFALVFGTFVNPLSRSSPPAAGSWSRRSSAPGRSSPNPPLAQIESAHADQ